VCATALATPLNLYYSIFGVEPPGIFFDSTQTIYHFKEGVEAGLYGIESAGLGIESCTAVSPEQMKYAY
jgi:hypothetical protein